MTFARRKRSKMNDALLSASQYARPSNKAAEDA